MCQKLLVRWWFQKQRAWIWPRAVLGTRIQTRRLLSHCTSVTLIETKTPLCRGYWNSARGCRLNRGGRLLWSGSRMDHRDQGGFVRFQRNLVSKELKTLESWLRFRSGLRWSRVGRMREIRIGLSLEVDGFRVGLVGCLRYWWRCSHKSR